MDPMDSRPGTHQLRKSRAPDSGRAALGVWVGTASVLSLQMMEDKHAP